MDVCDVFIDSSHLGDLIGGNSGCIIDTPPTETLAAVRSHMVCQCAFPSILCIIGGASDCDASVVALLGMCSMFAWLHLDGQRLNLFQYDYSLFYLEL